MFRSYLFASLFLSVLLTFGGCTKKTVSDAEVISAPEVTKTASEPVTPPIVEVDDKGLETILFDYDSFALTSKSRQLLKNNAEWLKKNPEMETTIEGYSDERGSEDYNLALGERRALSTRNYLVELGVAPERVDIISYGEKSPVSAGHDEKAWKQNRRVEFTANR